MVKAKVLFGIGFALVLGACQSTDMASRGAASAPSVTLATQGRAVEVPAGAPTVMQAQYDVADVRISVPRTLRVSEANVYYPIADIVWRAEPRGDRHRQVAAIWQEAMAKGTQGMTKGPRVIVEVEVTRHHCLTEKTRYTVGGTHSLHFTLTVRDAASGQVIEGPRAIVADTKAAGGQRAIAEEQAGLTQRVVVVDRLAQVIRRELSAAVPATPEMLSQLSSPVTVSTSAKNEAGSLIRVVDAGPVVVSTAQLMQ